MVSYDLSYVFKFLPEILYALPLTLWILIVTIVIGSLLGALLAWGQLYGDEVIVSISKGYVFVLRCTPPIVLLFMVFYGLPEFLEWWLGLDCERMVTYSFCHNCYDTLICCHNLGSI